MQQALSTELNGGSGRALTIALGVGVALLVLPYVAGLIGAAILYVVAAPVVRGLDPARRHRWPPLIAVVALFAILVLPGVLLLAELLAQVPEAARSLQQSAAVQRLMAIQLGEVNVGEVLRQASSDMITWSSRQTIAALGSVVTATLNLVIALFGAYYLLVSGDVLWQRLKAILPFCPTTCELLRARFHRVTEAMLLGVVLTGFAQGVLVAAALAVLGFSNALFWGAVTAVVSILPVLGSALVWLPATLVLLAQDRLVAGVGLGLFGALVIANIDNALRIIVYKRVSKIHPMVTLVGAFAGVRMFGLPGLLIGPLVLSYAVELFTVSRAGAVASLETAS